MAKAKMEDARALPQPGTEPAYTQEKTHQSAHFDTDPFALVRESNHLQPSTNARLASAEDAAQEDSRVPLKGQIASHVKYTLKINGVETPIYKCPLPGFEHMFTTEPQPAALVVPYTYNFAGPPNRTPGAAPNAGRAPELRKSKLPSSSIAKPSTSGQRARWGKRPWTRGVKRTRSRARRDAHYSDDDGDDPVTKVRELHNLYINDIDQLKAFYHVRLRELTMKPLRQIVTAWVKQLCPKRASDYCPYTKNETPRMRPELKHPPWWPLDCVYVEPSHLKLCDLVPLAIEILQVHREIDEQSGKRGLPWIKTLRKRAINSVDETPNDNFSSSTDIVFNEAMKARALEKILPSLFDIAEAHEDYIHQYELFEGSGNEDPGRGKEMSWERISRPGRRSAARKSSRPSYKSTRARRGRQLEQTPEDSGEETEVDEELRMAGDSFSSFHSTSTMEDDAEFVRQPSPAREVMTTPAPNRRRSAFPRPPSLPNPHSAYPQPHAAFDQTSDQLIFKDEPDVKATSLCAEQMQFSGMHANPGCRLSDYQPMDVMQDRFTGPASYNAPLDGGMYPQPPSMHHAPHMSSFQSLQTHPSYDYMAMPDLTGLPYGPDPSLLAALAPQANLLPLGDFNGLPMNFGSSNCL